MLIYQENNDFATSAIAKSLGTSTTIYLCAGQTQIILNVNMNFRNFDCKTLFYYIFFINDYSIFNLTNKFIGATHNQDLMELKPIVEYYPADEQ